MLLLLCLPAINKRVSKFHQLPLVYITIGTLLIIVVWSSAVSSPSFAAEMPVIIAAAILFSPLGLVIAAGTSSLPVIATALGQIGIATWFHPFTKHFQQTVPLISLSLSTTLLLPIVASQKDGKIKAGLQKTALVLLTGALLFPCAIIGAKTLQSIPVAIDDNNASGAFDSVTYRAVKKSLEYEGAHGFDQGYNQARLYFGNNGQYFNGESTTPQSQAAWLAQHNIRVLVTTNEKKVFTREPSWQLVGYFKSEGKEERLFESFVYLIP